jgi:hypothetical protein
LWFRLNKKFGGFIVGIDWLVYLKNCLVAVKVEVICLRSW